MRHVAAEFLSRASLHCSYKSARHSARARQDIGHAAVEQILGTQFGVHVNQDTVGSLSLAGVAGHGIPMIEMRMLARIEFYRSATVDFQAQPPVFLDPLDGPQLAVRNFEFVGRRSELNAVAC